MLNAFKQCLTMLNRGSTGKVDAGTPEQLKKFVCDGN